MSVWRRIWRNVFAAQELKKIRFNAGDAKAQTNDDLQSTFKNGTDGAVETTRWQLERIFDTDVKRSVNYQINGSYSVLRNIRSWHSS